MNGVRAMRTYVAAVRLVLTLVLGSLAVTASASDLKAPLRTKVGIIQKIDLADSTMIVEGMLYRVAIDVHVEINGSYGAFSMLETGMQIEYTYEVHSDTERTIVEIQQIPASFSIDRV